MGRADVRPGQDSLRLRALDRADFERFIQSVQAETTGLDLARCCPRPLQLDALFTDGCDPAGVDLSAGIDQITALMQLKPRCRVRCRRVPTGANRDQGADQIERCPDQADPGFQGGDRELRQQAQIDQIQSTQQHQGQGQRERQPPCRAGAVLRGDSKAPLARVEASQQGQREWNRHHPAGQFAQQRRAAAAIEPPDRHQQGCPQREQQIHHGMQAPVDGLDLQQAIAQRHQHEHQPWGVVDPVDDAFQVGKPLHGGESSGPQGPLTEQEALEGARRPALALLNKILDGFRGQPRAELFLEKLHRPALAAECQSGHEILGERRLHESTHLLKGLASGQEGGACAHHGPPAVPDGLDPAVETFFIGEHPLLHAEIAHHRIGIDEVLRCLQKTQPRILEEPDAALQKMVLRDEIGIEHRHQIAAADPESVIEIPRFGMAAVGPMPVGTAQSLGQVLHLRPAAVVQHPNLRTLVGLTTAPREAPLQHRDRFSAGRDEDRHLRSPLARL